MARNRFATGTVIATLALGFAFMAGYAAQVRLQPAVVAFIDLERVFNSLDSRKSSEAAMMELARDMEQKTTTMREELELLQAELESLEPGSTAMSDMNDSVVSVAGRLRAYQKYASILLEREQAKDLRETYERIKESAAAYSREQGIDVVLLNDMVVDMENSDSAGTLNQISSRRIIYAGQELDITDELIAMMNSADAG